MTDNEQERLVIDVSRLDPEGEELEGELDCVDVQESLVKAFGGVRYDLTAQICGTELLVRGHLEQDFDLVCSRCGKDFDDTIKVDDFCTSYEVGEKTEEVDLTEDIRESIILNLPTYPVCDASCKGLTSHEEVKADERWNVLDNLKTKE